jgi:hypothetical protein
MSLERLGEQHVGVVDRYVNPSADYQLTTYDQQVRPDATAGALTITLPPVAEAKGRFYSIVVRFASAQNTVTIADNDDSECWVGDIVLNGKCDRVLLYSDGLCWIPVAVIDEASYY